MMEKVYVKVMVNSQVLISLVSTHTLEMILLGSSYLDAKNMEN